MLVEFWWPGYLRARRKEKIQIIDEFAALTSRYCRSASWF